MLKNHIENLLWTKIDGDETIRILDDIAALEPGKNAQIAAKKISQKYKKIGEANAKKRFK